MALNMVAIDGIPHPHGRFQMNPIPDLSVRQRGEVQGLLDHVEKKAVRGGINHRQTDAIEGDGIPRSDRRELRFGTNRQTNPRRLGLGGQNFPEMANHTREHGDSSLTMRT